MEQKSSLVFKIVVIGEELTGKSTLITTFSGFRPNWYLKYPGSSHLIPEFGIRLRKSAIQRKGSKAFSVFYQSAAGFLLIFSLCDRYSFTCLESWFDYFAELRINTVNKLLVVGTKADLAEKREVSFEEVQELLSKYDLNYIELSANDINQVELALGTLINGIVLNYQLEALNSTEP